MRKRTNLAVGARARGASAAAIAGPSAGAAGSRLDDGKDLRGQAKISEQQAIEAAQTRASGALNEVDLEHAGDRLVYNVDVGSKDVKIDTASGRVVGVDGDD